MNLETSVNNVVLILEELQKQIEEVFKNVQQTQKITEQKWRNMLPRFWSYLIDNFRIILTKWVLRVYDINKGHAAIEPQEIVNWIIGGIHILNNKILIDFDLEGLVPVDHRGRPLFKFRNSGYFRQTREQIISNANEQWQLPINGTKEDDFYFENSLKELTEFVNKNFVNYIIKQLG